MIYHRGHREHRGRNFEEHLLCVLCVLCGSTCQRANAVEYLPGIAWPEPEVVTPGKSNSEPPSDAVVLFDGKDLSAWNDDGSWTVEDGVMIVGNRDIRTKQKFGSCQVHLEWKMPNPPKGKGQKRGNSGIYFMPHYERERGLFWKYEIQILDSYDNKTYHDGQAGAIYKQSPPMVNVMRPPGEWNVYDLIFVAPKFQDDGSLESPAYVTLMHNGVLVQNHFEMAGPTSYIAPPSYTKHAPRLPIGLQNHGQKVRYRNIWIREIPSIVGTREHAPMYRAGKVKWPVGEERPKERVKEKLNKVSSTTNSKWEDFFFGMGKGMAKAHARQVGIELIDENESELERVPRFTRWKVRYQVDTVEQLGQCLDEYDIMIGVLGENEEIYLASKLMNDTPKVAKRLPGELSTYGYMRPEQPAIRSLVTKLAGKAGIGDKGPVTLLIYPFDTEAELYRLEREAHSAVPDNHIRETNFRVVKKQHGYRYEVESIEYFSK